VFINGLILDNFEELELKDKVGNIKYVLLNYIYIRKGVTMHYSIKKRLKALIPILLLTAMVVVAITASPAMIFADEHEGEEMEGEEMEGEEMEGEEVEGEEMEAEEPAEELPETGFNFLPYNIGAAMLLLAGLGIGLITIRKRAYQHNK
jgi:hypothetical protein